MKTLLFRGACGLYKSLWHLEYQFFRSLPFLKYCPRLPVISVGNLTVGGTGKTPLLLALLSELVPRYRVAVLTRGYRSPWERSFYLIQGSGPHPSELTDETVLVHQRFPEVPILLGKNRYHSARRAERWLKPDLLLVDDGFQYRRLQQDFRLLLWDATDAPEQARLLPWGRLREPLERLRDASVIVLTRTELVSSSRLAETRQILSELAPGVPLMNTKIQAEPLKLWNGHPASPAVGEKRLLPFAAIARPEHFATHLHSLGYQQVEPIWFRDHHRFSDSDLEH
ncbi:MAG TPA: tetraacyldisaccharide 4'-kinase, partial [Candidatus Ozemobacteraceae bacterium]|nr:tetraacyldisaccharide 4'-kinase [Candidatus Ozemobacteraceae bacterium]